MTQTISNDLELASRASSLRTVDLNSAASDNHLFNKDPIKINNDIVGPIIINSKVPIVQYNLQKLLKFRLSLHKTENKPNRYQIEESVNTKFKELPNILEQMVWLDYNSYNLPSQVNHDIFENLKFPTYSHLQFPATSRIIENIKRINPTDHGGYKHVNNIEVNFVITKKYWREEELTILVKKV